MTKAEKYQIQNLITKLIQAKEVWITMYGHPKEEDEILSIRTEDIDHFCIDWNGEYAFVWIWGFPGPDYNVYVFSDYGKTWALTRKELEVTNECWNP